MPVCTFFGHRDCPTTLIPKLRAVLLHLIKTEGVDVFYVGNQGMFDRMVRHVLRQLQRIYPHIRYAVVLADLPGKADVCEPDVCSDTMWPEGIETVPRRFAISWRNQWMLQQSDYVVTYITHDWGGAARFGRMAERQRKTIIRLAEGTAK